MKTMFDIEKELSGLKCEAQIPGEQLRRQTRRSIAEALEKKRGRGIWRRQPLVFSSVAVAAAVIAVFFMFLSPAQAAGYYTIDINPSISVAVDENDIVLSVTARNEDASSLLYGMSLCGLEFEQALKEIVKAAVEDAYLKEGGHLLIARFGDGGGLSQYELDEIISGEALNVNALVLKGQKGEFKKAGNSGESAGVRLLLKNAHSMGIEDDDVDDVIRMLREKDKDKPKDNAAEATPDNGNAAGDGQDDKNTGNAGNDDKNKNGGSSGGNGDKGNNNGNGNPQNDKEKSNKASGNTKED